MPQLEAEMVMKYKNFAAILVALLPIFVIRVESQCAPTVTTVSGKNAPMGKLCSGQLILDENFNNFDNSLWEHEITLGGGGVSIQTFQANVSANEFCSSFSIELGIPVVYRRS